MNRLKKWISATGLLMMIGAAASAQTLQSAPTYTNAPAGNSKVSVNLFYNYSLPTGSFKNDLIKNGSPRGFNADILYRINQKWGVGAGFGWQDYYQKNARQLYKLSDGSDISAVLSHSIQVVPAMANGGSASHIQPYVSLAAGANFIHFSEYLGEFTSLNNTRVAFGAEAGGGIKISLGAAQKAGFLIGANYRYSPYNKYAVNNLNSLNLQAGFQFRLSK
jgi:hypothetical protein